MIALDRLFGREDELTRVAAALEGGRRWIVVRGEPDMGVSRLLRALADEAEDHWRVVPAAATRDGYEPYRTWLRASGHTSEHEPGDCIIALEDALLVLDDAQCFGDRAASFASEVLHHPAGPGPVLVLGVHGRLPPNLAERLAEPEIAPHGLTLELAPLPDADIFDMGTDDGRPQAELVDVARRSGGNPGLARLLLDGDLEAIDARISERLASCDEATRAHFDRLVVAGFVHDAVIASMFGAAEDTRRWGLLADRGLARPVDDVWRVPAPILAERRLAILGADEIAALRSAVVRVAATLGATDWLAERGFADITDPLERAETAARIETRAGVARAAGEHDRACDLYALAAAFHDDADPLAHARALRRSLAERALAGYFDGLRERTAGAMASSAAAGLEAAGPDLVELVRCFDAVGVATETTDLVVAAGLVGLPFEDQPSLGWLANRARAASPAEATRAYLLPGDGSTCVPCLAWPFGRGSDKAALDVAYTASSGLPDGLERAALLRDIGVGYLYGIQGKKDTARRAALDLVECARHAGLLPLELVGLALDGIVRLLSGDRAGALERLADARALRGSFRHPVPGTALGDHLAWLVAYWLGVDDGPERAAPACREAVAAGVAASPLTASVECLFTDAVIAWTSLSSGDAQAATDHVSRAIGDAVELDPRLLGIHVPLVLLARAAHVLDDERLAHRLLPLIEAQVEAFGLRPALFGDIGLALGELAETMGGDGREAMAEAYTRSTAGGRMPLAAMAASDLAAALRQHGEVESATWSAREAQGRADFGLARRWELPAAVVERDSIELAPAVRDGPGFSEPLTNRELEVLRHIALGLTAKEIADALVLSPHTVQRHTANIYRKTGWRNRAEATGWAHLHGLLADDLGAK